MNVDKPTTDDVVLERIWQEIHQRHLGNDSELNNEEGNNNKDVAATFISLSDHLKCGYTTDEASKLRESLHNDRFNVVPPPVDCPAWLCLVLPCIKHLKSMKAHKNCMPEDAEVLRNGKWIRYDAASLVVGDIIRLEEGDIVPADCVVNINDCNQEEYDDDLLVDLKAVTGRSRPKLIPTGSTTTRDQRTLLLGGTVVQGRARAIVTVIGKGTILGQLIKDGKFPVDEATFGDDKESIIMDEETKNLTTMELGTMT